MPGFFWRLRDFLNGGNRQPNNIIAGRDGRLYEIRDAVFGRLVLHKPLVPSLDDIREGFEFRLPKIPGDLLTAAISFFKAYCCHNEQLEVMVQVFYNLENGQYELDCPEQTVRWDSIEADCTQRSNDPRYVQVLHIHSHNAMPAFFSPTDNRDEQAYRLYAVIGNLMGEVPEMMVRVGARGQFISLPIDYIFDKPDLCRVGTYPEEWHDHVHKGSSGYEYDLETMMPLMYKYWISKASEAEVFEETMVVHNFPSVHAANMVEQVKGTNLEDFISDCGPAWHAFLREVIH